MTVNTHQTTVEIPSDIWITIKLGDDALITLGDPDQEIMRPSACLVVLSVS